MDSAEEYRLQPARVWTEFVRLLPIGLFVMIFGAAFGLAAVQHGLAPWHATLMSATVFAGAAQFAALGLWGAEVMLLPLIATTLAINSRHVLMGASLYPMLRSVPPARRYAMLVLLTDANWAISFQEYQWGRRNLEVIVGGGLALWLAWVLGTLLGVYFGGFLHDPESLGLDMVMGCFLLTMALGGRRSWRLAVIWLVAGTSSVAAYWWLPPHTYVVVGALAGGVVGFIWWQAPSHAH